MVSVPAEFRAGPVSRDAPNKHVCISTLTSATGCKLSVEFMSALVAYFKALLISALIYFIVGSRSNRSCYSCPNDMSCAMLQPNIMCDMTLKTHHMPISPNHKFTCDLPHPSWAEREVHMAQFQMGSFLTGFVSSWARF